MRGALLPTLWLLPLLAAAQPAPPQVPASAGEVAGRPAAATDPRLPLLDAMAAIDPIVVRPPFRRGDVVVRDLLGLGVDLVATDDLLGDGR